MTFNEFQKELNRRVSDPQLAYMLTFMYEKMVDMGQQLDMCAKIINSLTETVGNFAALHEKDQALVKQLMRRGRPDGVEVESVAMDPDETEH